MNECTSPAVRPATASGAGLSMTRGALVAMRCLGTRAAALALLAAVGFATPAAADDVLVSNIDQLVNTDGGGIRLREHKHALGFTTGSHGTGYTLNSIDLRTNGMRTSDGINLIPDVTVQLATGLMAGASTGSYTIVATLINPPGSLNPPGSRSDATVHRFTAPTGTVLHANTKYWVVAMASGEDHWQTPSINLPPTWADGETGKSGWSVDDTRLWSGRSGRWASDSDVFMMRVNGTERSASQPVLTISGGSAVTEGSAASFTVTSDRAPSNPLAVNLTVSEPAGSDYVASSDEGSKTVTIPANATTATFSVATQANSAVEPHGSVTVRVATGTGYALGTNSGASVAVHEATPPPLPVIGLTASYSGATAIDLTWALPTQLAGVTVTGLEVQQESAGSWTTVASLGAAATSHTVTGLTNGESYTFRVRVAANHGAADSETVSTTVLALPKPATGLTFSNVTGTTVDLSWTLPEQGAGVVVSRVEVDKSRETDAWGEPVFREGRYTTSEHPGNATSATEGVSHGGVKRHFRVRLITNTGSVDSEVASWSSPLPLPEPPTDLTFSNVTGTTIDLSWTLPEQGEGVVVSAVEVKWEEDDYYGTSNGTSTVTLAGDAVSHTVTGLSPSTAYEFQVWLFTNSGTRYVEEEEWTAAAVSGVAVVSDAGGDDTYALGEAIRIRVSFTGGDHSDYPDVDTSGGIPRLKIDMGGGAKWAAYESSDYGTSDLTFAYTVVEPDVSTKGIAVLANTLELNGGAIRVRGWFGNVDLSHAGLDHDAAHKVDWRKSPAPAAPVEVVSRPRADDTYALGEEIRIRAKFGEAMNVTGAPRLKMAMDGADERWAAYEDGSGTDSLTFAYTVEKGDTAFSGIAVLANSLELNGGTIRSAASSTDADLEHTGLDHDPAHQVDWFHTAPEVEELSRPASGDSYVTGETIRVRLTFSEALDVTGTPRLGIWMDRDESPERWAAYEGGSGTSSLTFAYTVVESDISKRMFSLNSLELNGGTIRWAGTQEDVPLVMGGFQSDHRLNWHPADAWVVGTVVDSRPASGDTYDIGETIRVLVKFDEAVDVTGTPRIKIKMDPEYGEKWATYAGVPGSSRTNQYMRIFDYTVVEPNISTQGIAVLANSLEANGGTIKAAATGSDADLAHDGLDHDPAHKVNWQLGTPTVPGFGIVSVPASGDTYGLGETILVTVAFDQDVLVAGTPRLKIKMDPAYGEQWATYEDGSGDNFLYFTYTVVEPNISTQGIALVADSLEANGGTIWSEDTGLIADLSHDGLDHDPAHKVDWQQSAPVEELPSVSVSHARAVEGDRVEFTVSLSAKIRGVRTVDYATSDGTAESGKDYEDTEGRLTFDSFETSQTVRLWTYGDDEDEGDETFTLELSNPRGVTLGDALATGTIEDDDGPLPLTASFENLPANHDGKKLFGFEIVFSEEFRGLKLTALKAGALKLTGGRLVDTKRVTPGENRRVAVRVRPSSDEEMTLTLAVTTDCAAASAICAADGRKLSSPVSATVSGPGNSPATGASAATGAPTISGAAQAGETLTASTDGIADADGLSGAAYSFQWVRSADGSDTDIAGATGASYVLADADVGTTVKVRASFTDDAGNSEELTSAPTARVEPRPNSAATGAPAISGEAQAGETLTASTEGIADADGLSGATFAFQWVSSADGSDTDISGATGRSYTLADSDVGATMKVRASFTDDAGNGEEVTSAATARVEPRPLTAEFEGMPAEHDGVQLFNFDLVFSENFPGKFPYTTLRDSAFTVTNGRVRGAERVVKGENRRWRIKVRPSSNDDLTITLAAGAVSTESGRPLANTVSATVAGPVGVSVADARVKEAAGAALAFAVTLSRTATTAFSVDYATSDGTAQAGADYTAASGTLSFQAGDSSKTIEVSVLDDAHDEGEETLTLRLSNASGAWLSDGEATGTIENTDLMPAALLARFGRATAEQVVTHIEERMAAPRQRGFRARFAGQELRPGQERDFALGLMSQFAQPMGMGPAGAAPLGGAVQTAMGSHAAGPGGMGMPGMSGAMSLNGMGGVTGVSGPGAMGMTGQHAPMGGAVGMDGYAPAGGAHGGGLFGSTLGYDPLSNSEFELNRESRGGILSVWSRSSRSHFSGIEDALSLNGDVRTTMFGADWARGPLTVGLSVGRTLGMGGYSGPSGGQMTTSMTGFYPWVGYQVNDRVSVWGTTGYGTGALSLTPDGQSALETGVSMMMSAVGTRGELVGSRATGGFALAFKADTLWVGAASDLLDGPTGRLNASEAGVTRVRTALEGSRGFTLAASRLSLTPSVEVGLRRDGGDAETGAGMDVGGGLAFTDAVTGLSLDVRVRTLVVHQAEGFSDRGMSLSFGWDPTPSSPLGLTARVAPSWGGQAQGGAEALWGNQMAYGMGSHQMYGAGGQLNAEVGYGLPVGVRFVGTPKVGLTSSTYGRDYRFGYGLGVLEQGRVNFELAAEAQRRESPTAGEVSKGFMGRATFGW